jgi:hypothetical protein
MSFELSYKDLRTVILSFGFQIEVFITEKKIIMKYKYILFILDRKITYSSKLYSK